MRIELKCKEEYGSSHCIWTIIEVEDSENCYGQNQCYKRENG